MMRPNVIFLVTFLVNLALVTPRIALGANTEPAPEEVTVYANPAPVEHPLGITLDAQQLEGIAGIQNDAVSAVVTLPGIAVNNDFDTGIAIRGSRPEDSRFFLDFLPVGYLFHLVGLSVVDTDVVEGFDLFGAGFDVDYQGVVGGIVDVRTRDPIDQGFAGLLDASILDAGILVEGAITGSQRAFFSARISYYDVVLGTIIEKASEDDNEGVDIIQLPKYRDYRGRYQVDVRDNLKLDVFIDGASDAVEFLFDDNASSVKLDPVFAGNHRFDISYDRMGAVLSDEATANGFFKVGLGQVQRVISSRRGRIGRSESKLTETTLRGSKTFADIGRHRFTIGGDLARLEADYDIAIRDNGCTEFDVDCRYSNSDVVTTDSGLHVNQENIFVEDNIALGQRLSLNLGAGYTQDDYLDKSAIEPRVRVGVTVSPQLALSASVGRYYQLPAFEYIEMTLGNPDLDYLKSTHYVAGMDLVLPTGLLLSFDIYNKTLSNVVTSDATLRYDNDGKGTARGAEFMLRKGLGRWTGWLSLSYSRSEREDPTTGDKFLFEFDQPVIASLVAKYKINDRFSIGGRAAFHSGPPTTRIHGGILDPDDPGGYLPVYGKINSDRLPNYFRVDLRMDWRLKENGDTRLYFEVINATNHTNVLDYEYAADYASRKNLEQLPLFVSVGVSQRF